MSTHREAADGRSRQCDYLMVFVKAPSPGEVKTRLAPALSADESADVYRCLVRDTLAVVRRLRGVQVVVAYSGNTAFPTLAWLRDGRPLASGRLLWGFKPQVVPQQGRTLGDRLIHAFGWAFSKGARRVVAVGSDAPELSASWVRQAFRELHHRPVVLGPTSDGGYQLIGLDAPYPALFVDMPWSSAQLFDRTLQEVVRLGLGVRCLEVIDDLDTSEDVRRYVSKRSGRRGQTRRYLTRRFTAPALVPREGPRA